MVFSLQGLASHLQGKFLFPTRSMDSLEELLFSRNSERIAGITGNTGTDAPNEFCLAFWYKSLSQKNRFLSMTYHFRQSFHAPRSGLLIRSLHSPGAIEQVCLRSIKGPYISFIVSACNCYKFLFLQRLQCFPMLSSLILVLELQHFVS